MSAPLASIPHTSYDYLAQRLDGARDLYLLALAVGDRGGKTGTFGFLIREARIHFASVIEEGRMAGLDTGIIARMLGELSEELADNIRAEIWDGLADLLGERTGRKPR